MEVIKYLPPNTEPKQFMHPPTEPFQGWVDKICLRLERSINSSAEKLHTGSRILPPPKLRIGSELELFIFHRDFDPFFHLAGVKEFNPNYSHAHRAAIKGLVSQIRPPIFGGLRGILQNYIEYNGGVFVEIRTIPTDTSGYLHQMEAIQEWIGRKSLRYGLRPVVHSQHLHLSLANHFVNMLDRGKNDLVISKNEHALANGIIDTYQRTIPWIRLPEEMGSQEIRYGNIFYDENVGFGIKRKGNNQGYPDPIRLEGRLNSSEYAADPHLNLLVHLIGVDRGLNRLLGIESSNFTPSFDLRKMNYEDALDRMPDDNVLLSYIPYGLIEAINRPVRLYRDISLGLMNVQEVRELAAQRSGVVSPSG